MPPRNTKFAQRRAVGLGQGACGIVRMRSQPMNRPVSFRVFQKRRSPATWPGFPRFPSVPPNLMTPSCRSEKGKSRTLSARFTLKSENVAETSRSLRVPLIPASKSPESCRFLIIAIAAGSAMNSNLMGFSLPHHGSPIGTRRGPVPPVGASSISMPAPRFRSRSTF